MFGHVYYNVKVYVETRGKRVTAQRPALFLNDMYRSFAPLRMTALRVVVILSGAKDLYEMCMGNVQNPSLYLGQIS